MYMLSLDLTYFFFAGLPTSNGHELAERFDANDVPLMVLKFSQALYAQRQEKQKMVRARR